MKRRFAGDFGSETETATTVMAPFVGHRAKRVALGMVAGPATRSSGHPGSWNDDDAHGFTLAVSTAPPLNLDPSRHSARLDLLTICSKPATYS